MPVPMQISPFEPATAFDAPGIIFKQIMDGEVSGRSVRQTLFDSGRLSPEERDSYATKLKAASGGNRITNALIDVAANPWVWFMMATTPTGAKGISGLFNIAKEFAPEVASKTVWHSLGSLTGGQVFRGTALESTAHGFESAANQMFAMPSVQALNARLVKAGADLGLDARSPFNWQRYAPGSAERQKAQEISVALEVELRRLYAPEQTLKVVAKEGGAFTTVREANDPILSNAGVREKAAAILDKHGLGDLPEAYRSMYKEVGTALFDPMAQIRASRVQGNMAKIMGEVDTRFFEQQMADHISGYVRNKGVDPDLIAALTDYQKALVDTGSYVPRNVSEQYIGGKLYKSPNQGLLDWMGSMIRPGGFRELRQAKTFYHPEDLQMIQSVFDPAGESAGLNKMIVESQDQMLRSTVGGPARFQRINPDFAAERYINRAQRDYAMYVAPVGDEVRTAVDGQLNRLKASGYALDPKTTPHYGAGHAGGDSGSILTGLGDLEAAGAHPAGGFSHADIFAQQYSLLQQEYPKRAMAQMILPHMLGRVQTEHAVLSGAMNMAKSLANTMLESPIGDAMKQSGKWGQDFHAGLGEWADHATTAAEAGGVARGISSAFYSAHLGFNPSSALINMFQPALFAGQWVGYKHLMTGYVKGFQETAAYVAARAKEGLGPIDPARRMKLLNETMPLTNHAGEDLLDVTQTARELAEGVNESVVRQRMAPADRARYWTVDFPMGLFSITDVMNKNVVAHATLSAMREEAVTAGKVLSDAELLKLPQTKSLIRTINNETNFTSHWMNRPLAMLPGNRTGLAPVDLSSNLASQFLTFPLRMLTTLGFTTPRLAGREGWAAYTGTFKDAARMMGMSAIIYETGKNLAGMDLQRAGLLATVTELSPFKKDSKYDLGPWPVPPVISVPVNFIRAVASDDMDLLSYTLPRALPGGVALAKAMGIAPRVPQWAAPLVGQKTYAGWDQRQPDGRVPLFKSDGTLIDYRSPAELVARGLGVDMGQFGQEGKFEGFLIQNREEILKYRQEAMRRLMANDPSGAESVKAEFQKKFGMPLTISQQQLRSAGEMRNVPRVQRTLDRLPPELRARYGGMNPASAPQQIQQEVQQGQPTESAFGSFTPY